jgi:hypothetical protein
MRVPYRWDPRERTIDPSHPNLWNLYRLRARTGAQPRVPADRRRSARADRVGLRKASPQAADLRRRLQADRVLRNLRGRQARFRQRAPTELELRDRYNASRNTVWGAVKWLTNLGLVETKPGSGASSTGRPGRCRPRFPVLPDGVRRPGAERLRNARTSRKEPRGTRERASTSGQVGTGSGACAEPTEADFFKLPLAGRPRCSKYSGPPLTGTGNPCGSP